MPASCASCSTASRRRVSPTAGARSASASASLSARIEVTSTQLARGPRTRRGGRRAIRRPRRCERRRESRAGASPGSRAAREGRRRGRRRIGAPSERFRRLARSADSNLPALDQVRIFVVRKDNYAVCVRYCQLLRRDLLQRLAEHVRVLVAHVREQHDSASAGRSWRRSRPPSPASTTATSTPAIGELGERGGGDRLELRRAEPFRRAAARA